MINFVVDGNPQRAQVDVTPIVLASPYRERSEIPASLTHAQPLLPKPNHIEVSDHYFSFDHHAASRFIQAWPIQLKNGYLKSLSAFTNLSSHQTMAVRSSSKATQPWMKALTN